MSRLGPPLVPSTSPCEKAVRSCRASNVSLTTQRGPPSRGAVVVSAWAPSCSSLSMLSTTRTRSGGSAHLLQSALSRNVNKGDHEGFVSQSQAGFARDGAPDCWKTAAGGAEQDSEGVALGSLHAPPPVLVTSPHCITRRPRSTVRIRGCGELNVEQVTSSSSAALYMRHGQMHSTI